MCSHLGFTDGICAARPVQFLKSSALNNRDKRHAQAQAASNVAVDKKMMMRCAMAELHFSYWLGGLTFFRPAIGLRGLIARISGLVDSQLTHGHAFQMIHQDLIFRSKRTFGNFVTQNSVQHFKRAGLIQQGLKARLFCRAKARADLIRAA